VTVSDTIALIASLVALFGLAVALATLWLGLRSYRDNARSTRLAHMHTLFGAYLEHELDFQLAKGAGQNVEEAERLLAAFKMYTLEEMWLWLENEERHPPKGDHARRDHDRLITGWKNTILYHIGKGTARELLGFLRARQCYSPGFVKLVRQQHPCSRRKRPSSCDAW